jgi:putative transposase
VHNVYALIMANQADLPVRTMCETFNVSTSGYYDWIDRPQSARQTANDALATQIHKAFIASDETYGMPRVRAQLRHDGVIASRKRVARLMQHNHWRGVSRRRGFCITTERDKRQRPAPDLVKRQFVATDMNQLWVADMTYLPTWAGFLYLAAITDVFSRKVVGWAFGARMTADLVTEALQMAVTTRQPQHVIHHSDQGSQYTSLAFGKRCEQLGVQVSMGTVGDAYDNAMAESFFASLECELINRRVWKTQTEARLAVFSWIEGWYNPHRLHSALGYMSPNNFEMKYNLERKNNQQNVNQAVTNIATITGLPTACFAPVDNTTHGLLRSQSSCPQASAVDNPESSRINQCIPFMRN